MVDKIMEEFAVLANKWINNIHIGHIIGLQVLFDFRTDLFVEQIGPDQKFGYPVGQCERLIYDSMQYFLLKAKERNQSG